MVPIHAEAFLWCRAVEGDCGVDGFNASDANRFLCIQ